MKDFGLMIASLVVFLLSFVLLLDPGFAAAPSAPAARSQPTNAESPARQPKTKRKKKARTVASRRVRRLSRAFVASADLQPMARQLFETRSRAAYAGVEAYARKHAQEDAGALAWLAVGYARGLDQDYAKAIDPLKRAQPHAGELRDYVDYFLAGAYAATGRSDNVIATLREFDTKYPDSLFLRDAMHAYGTALIASGNAAEAVRVLEQYRNPTRPDIELTLGRAYAKTGEYVKAAEALRRVYYAYPLSPEAADARSELDRLATGTTLPPPGFAERKARADLLAQAHHNADAAREYQALLADTPPASRVGIQVALGVALHRGGNDGEARSVLQSASEAADEDNALRWFTLAEIARSADDEAGFNDAVAQLRQGSTTSDKFQQALLLGGNMYLLRKNYDKAIDYYRELQQRFPNSKRAPYAHWKAAWLELRQGRKEEAKSEFEQQVSLYPDSPEAPAALYWRARLAENDGELDRARAWYLKVTYRFHQYYYAELARARLKALPPGEAVADPVLDGIAAPAVPGDVAAAAGDPPGDNVRYHKSLLLHNGGMTELAVRELRAAAPEGTGWVMMEMANYYQDDGLYYRALQALKRAVPSYYSLALDALPRPYWETLFPRPYWKDLTRYARRNRLDPFVVASLIRQESEFNPGAVSSADALGLMQLLPNTGRKVARELHVRRFATSQLLTPDFNMQLGTRYFRNLVDQFGGRLEYALAAYNAGSDRVQDWLADGSYDGADQFVESIPFTETREYVQAILRNAAIYRRLYGMP